MGANVGIFLERKKAATVVDEIWAQLRRLILQGTLVPGTRLVELDIAAQTGASQGSVREALQRLERDGLVVRRGRNGTFVTEVSPAEMHEIFRIRGVVESCAIRRLARRVRPEQLEELRELVERMREAGRAGDTVAVVGHDMAFHQRICAWAEHPILLRVWTLLHGQLERFLVIYDASHFADLTTVADNHLPILEALEAGDADAAAERIERHVMIGAPPESLD
ncbi:MAG TPA: GntR family transcriptional regulator [Longimicrobiales bacterium]